MAGRVHVDRKGSRSDKRRPSRSVKKRPPLTKTKMESEETMTSAANNLNEYRHKPALSKIVEDAIRPVYESLSEEDLLAKCTGSHTQNANESLNALIWKIAPKETYSGFIIVEIAAYISTVIFNEGSMSLLTILETLNCTIGNAAYYMCQEADAQRILTGELQAQEATREARIRRRQIRLQSEEGHIAEEGQLYGAGIAD